ncbi:hypothetical protein [Cylindrospermum sp. FACHB-282]|uniref:hypothetical protein n=1 Tax=Cylindrospermum sp. FACHB-282 TaxID=2692794 RepID=UPI001688F77A|nr:hypothetical protein [Cylindrospermum sp. FACHB-282]MBD2385022.1 hypothetical protein [Cylindrospermum sp. FACHB-282]
MGNFQAITTENDQPVEFTGDAINSIAISQTKAPAIQNYYKSILKAALTNFKLKTELTPTKQQEAKNFEKETMKDLWKASDVILIGYILQDTHLSKDIDTLLTRIADEENKYYWKWLESGNEVKDADNNSETVLNQLRIANVRLLNRIFINTPADRKLWIEKEKPDQDETLIVPAIAISPAGTYTHNDYSYYGVYVNTEARLLFLDNSENTQKYKYGKNADTNDYGRQKTYIYDHIYIQGKQVDDQNAEYFWGEDKKNYRYLLKLKNQINKLATKYGSGNVSGSKIDVSRLSETILLNKIKFKTTDSQEGTKKNNAEKQAAKELAKAAASQIPTGNYHCFYHDNGGTLMGHISSVLIGEGGRGGSGYPMRADKVNEVNYQWLIALPKGDNNIPLTKLWSYLFELDPKFLVDAPPAIQKNRTSQTANAFYPTNWPYDKGVGFTNQVTGMESWIQYYKTFNSNSSVTRRNKPGSNPFPPRVTNPNIAGYDYKFDIKTIETSVKLDNTSYRVWKKINSQGGALTLGTNKNDREDAGTTMAEALRDFHVYAKMKTSDITPKITDSKLSATAFAKYVVGKLNDDAVEKQWRLDNKLDTNVTVDVSSLKTDQEWCHLFGHGDGGPEELGNFVSGSKHCNTEQLAIETGQRRVSQNTTDFTQTERDKLKAKITAYLIPNSGTWVSGKTYTETDLNTTLLESITLPNVESIKDDFFEVVPSTDPVEYRLKSKTNLPDSIVLKKAFKDLSDKISNSATSNAEKKELFQFRHNLEKHFFMYLPIARWMRYKIYYGTTKVFDHIYDAQSESMNLHECQILDYTVERELYKAMGKWDEYKKKIKERVEKLIPTPEEADITERVLNLDAKLFEIFNNLKLIDNYAGEIVNKIKFIISILESSSPDLKQIEIDIKKIIQDNLNLGILLKNITNEIQNQQSIYNQLEIDFKNKLTEEQKKQSKLISIIADKKLSEKIDYLKTISNNMHGEQLDIAEKSSIIITKLAEDFSQNQDSVKNAANNVQEAAKNLKRTREEMSQDKATLGNSSYSLKRQKSITDNYNKA